MSLLADRYAQALFAAAQAQDAIEPVARDLEALAKTLHDTTIARVVLAADTPRALRAQTLDRLGPGWHALTKGLVKTVLERRRVAVLPELAVAFTALVRRARGEVHGQVETGKPLTHEQLTELERAAGRLTGKTVRLTVKDAPELLGGVRLRVGNTLYDGSVASALQELERQLMAAPLQS